MHDRQAVRLVHVGRYLGNRLARRNANGDGQSDLLGDSSPEPGGDGLRRGVRPHAVGYVEKCLVEGHRLDEQGDGAEYLHDLSGDLVVAVESGGDPDGLRASLHGSVHGHGGADAERPRLV